MNPNENEQPPKLETTRAKNILAGAYYISQGSRQLNRNIFKYLKVQDVHLELPNSYPGPQNIYGRSTQMATQMARRGMHKSTEDDLTFNRNAATDYGDLASILEGEDPESQEESGELNKSELIKTILGQMIQQDTKFLIEKGGRQRPETSNDPYNPLMDRYLSQFCYYVLADHPFDFPVQLPEYDQLLGDLQDYVKKNGIGEIVLPSEDVPKTIREKDALIIVDFYNKHHPDATVKYPLTTSS